MSMLVHATCVAIGGRAVLITGESGAGKSDLALRLIDRGAVLVSDDQVALSVSGSVLRAAAPERIAGKIEVRGIGIVSMAHQSDVPLALLIALGAPPRMPEAGNRELCGQTLPCAIVDPREPSAPIKVELALERWGLHR
ncbi:HPr kinase/phosphatase C-terminal domain-containing protein [Sphingomonas sp.]|jgi:alpha-D-ribose 1-methylphosphonate 5-triphosphate synthase subunit PhnL|uniref:HPr kinase/phosphorylase n=1 Tax=Sphingomonas sp. TaxID=28214 RepID=UPI002DEABC09|nr:HPr kinase/phosphatase C-terminal domain-containing protein [Sphingomonas sp.]